MRKAIYWLMALCGVSLVCLFCGCKEKKDNEVDIDLLKAITTHFDENELKYELEQDSDEESDYYIYTGFKGDNERVNVRIDVHPKLQFYAIIGYSDTKVDSLYRDAAIRQMNVYNAESLIVPGYIDEKGRIVFWLARNTDGGAFSEKGFDVDMMQVVNKVDDETAHIFKTALENYYSEQNKHSESHN